MVGLRVGVEIQAPAQDILSAMATLAWMSPERIELDEQRSMVLLSTSFGDAVEACSYAERRIRKSAIGMGLELPILCVDAFPPVLDLRQRPSLDTRRSGRDTRY
jgi:hypothetical protein